MPGSTAGRYASCGRGGTGCRLPRSPPSINSRRPASGPGIRVAGYMVFRPNCVEARGSARGGALVNHVGSRCGSIDEVLFVSGNLIDGKTGHPGG
jgi:hypothetical protein